MRASVLLSHTEYESGARAESDVEAFARQVERFRVATAKWTRLCCSLVSAVVESLTDVLLIL